MDDELKPLKLTLICLRIAIVYMGLVGLSFLLFGGTLMRLWSSDDKVIQTGTEVYTFRTAYKDVEIRFGWLQYRWLARWLFPDPVVLL
jgi:hypothetical protein